VLANESFTNSGGDFAINGSFNLRGGTTTVVQVSTRGIGINSGAVLRVSGTGTVLNANWVKPGNLLGSTNSVFWIENGGIANLGGLSVGSNANKFGFGAYALGVGAAIVTNGGILRTDKFSTASNGMGSISVVASTVELATNTPVVILGTAGSFTFASSTLAFRGVTNANFFSSPVTNITYSGDNTLSLRAATNAMLGSYTFQTNNGQAFAFLDLQGGVFRSTNLTVGSGGKITGSGLVASFNVNSQGTLAPGNSPGTLAFASNLTLDAASVLNIELGGTNSVDFDRLIANGALNLGGTLNVTLINGYTPGAGDTVDILDWGAIFGSFSTVNLPSAEWSAANLYTDGTLTFAAIPEPAAGTVLVGALALLVLVRGLRRGE
jgi:hypothetical protein